MIHVLNDPVLCFGAKWDFSAEISYTPGYVFLDRIGRGMYRVGSRISGSVRLVVLQLAAISILDFTMLVVRVSRSVSKHFRISHTNVLPATWFQMLPVTSLNKCFTINRLTRGERPALGIFVRWKSGFFISNFHFSFFKISKRRSTFFRKFSIFVNSTFCATQSRFLATLRDITQLPNTFPTDSDGFSTFQKSISTIFR